MRRTGQDHDGNDVPAPFREPQLDRGPPRERNHRNSGEREHDPHRVEWDVVRVCGARGEIERAIEPGQSAGETDEHFAERGVDLCGDGPKWTTVQPQWIGSIFSDRRTSK